jgi:RNA polymerase sigma-70 factor (sigma-E family)
MPPSYEQFVTASTPRLVRAARMLLGNTSEAEDMAQETLIVMHQHWARLRNQDAADAYAHRTLVRLTRRHLRSARVRHESLANHETTARSESVEFPGEGDGALQAALAVLPRRQREALVLRYYLDFSIDETARVMRCTNGTVKSQVSKALASLREQLHHPDQSTPAGQP